PGGPARGDRQPLRRPAAGRGDRLEASRREPRLHPAKDGLAIRLVEHLVIEAVPADEPGPIVQGQAVAGLAGSIDRFDGGHELGTLTSGKGTVKRLDTSARVHPLRTFSWRRSS